MATVSNTARHADGDPAAHAAVVIRLAGEAGRRITGYLADDAGTVIAPALLTADADGAWSAELIANELIEPAGTVYAVTERAQGEDPAEHYIDVPAGDGTYNLEELLSGPPGVIAPIAGPRGPAGTGGESIVFVFEVPASSWSIEHSWPGGYPSVTVVDTLGREVIADVVYESDTVITVSFAGATAGRAFLN